MKMQFKSSEEVISVTDEAVQRINYLLSTKKNEEKKPIGIRVNVVSGGCSGLKYDLAFTYETEKFDNIVEASGVHIYISPKALMFLKGSVMDYITTKFKSGFVFRNPNEKGTCGCGESFRI